MKKNLTLLALVFLCFAGIAQVKVGLPISAPHTSAVLDLSNLGGSPKGLLLPNLTTAQRNLISLPAAGLVIYNTDVSLSQYWNGIEWVSQTDGGSAISVASIDGITIQQYGVYQVGTATSAGNYITVTVNVTTTGSWSAQTNTKNGVNFKGGGVFTTIGTNTVKLYALRNVLPRANGIATYTMAMGNYSENFNVLYNSNTFCLAPTPAISTTALCAIKAGTTNTFTVTGGNINSSTFIYTISPSAGVSTPTGDMISGTTPAITFSIPGNYTITYKSSNLGYPLSCSQSSISASQTFSVTSGPVTATPVAYCNTGRFGPASFNAGRTFVSLVDGVSVTTTWSGTINNSTYLYANCGFAAAPSPNFNINSGAGNTFTFSHPVGNLQLITGFDNSDKITITAKNGATDVTDQLVISKLTPACTTNNYNQTSCNSFTALGAATTTLGLNIGGAYFTSITFTVNNNDCQFDLSFCNAKSIACLPPAPIVVTSVSNPLLLPIPVVAGNSITFSATGGLPKTSDITWELSSVPAGMLSGVVTGTGNTALATLASTVTGEITAIFTVTNAGTGGCFPTTISGKQTFKVVSGTPAVNTTFCSSFIGTNELPNASSSTVQAIGTNSVTITRSGNTANASWSQNVNACGTPLVASTNFNGSPGTYTFSFDKDVSNLQIISGMDVKDDKHTYTIYKNGIDISSQLVLTVLGTCPGNSTILNNTITLNNSVNSNVAVSLGGVYFDRLDVSYSGPGGDSQFQLGVCQGSSVDGCVKPDAFVITNFRNPAIFPTIINAGNTVTFSAAGGTPNTSGISWAITSIPDGLVSGETTGTGSIATAVLTANATGSVTAKFAANNMAGSCNVTPVKGSQSVFLISGIPAASTTFCTNFIGTNELVSNTSTTEQTIGVNKVIISRLGSNVNSTFSQTYASCATPMNSNACFDGTMGVNTFKFSNDVINIQVLSGMSRVNDMMTFTIYKNGVDISSQLVVAKIGSCDRNINSPVNNTIQLNVSSLNNVVVNLGGVYFDRLDIAYTSSGNTSPSNPFQLSLCNAVSIITCTTPSAVTITSTTTPSVLPYPVAVGNSVNFTATGGLPNTGISWVLSSVPDGILSGVLTGVGNVAKASLIANASGDVTATYTYGNSGLGDCNPTAVVISKTQYITAFCSDFVDFYKLPGTPSSNSVTTQKIGQNMVKISRSGFQDDWQRSQNNNICGTAMASDGSFKASALGTAVFNFDKSVSNIQVLTSMGTVDNTMSFRIYRNGVEVTDRLVLAKLGKCADFINFPTNSSVRVVRSNSSNAAVVLGGIYFDKLTIDYRGDIVFGGGYTAFQLGLCTGSSTEIVACYNDKPAAISISSSTSPSPLPNVTQDGNVINFTASGGQPRVGSLTYTLTSFPATGILTGVTTGTGYFATVRLLANAKGTVTVTYTATNTDGSCTPSTTSASKTINVAVDCPSPDPIQITSSTSPSVLPYIIQLGNTINFSATGGTPNNGSLQWTLSSEPAGLVSSATSGTGNSASAVLVANATGKVTVNFTATYASSGDCVPIPVAQSKTVILSSFCGSFIGNTELPTNTSTSTQTIGNNQVVISRSGNAENEQYISTNNSCGTPSSNDQAFRGSPVSAYTFNFSQNVKDIQLLSGMDITNDKMTFKIYKKGVDITSGLELSNLGNCPGNISFNSGSDGKSVTLLVNTSSNVVVNLGGVYFDRIDILYAGPGGDAQFILGLCQASSFVNCATPSGLQINNSTTPAALPYLIEAGNSIDFISSGSTSNTGITWALTSVPDGLLSGTISGTGALAKAVLTKNATGSVTVTYTVTNASGACEPSLSSFSKTVKLSSVCTNFIGYNVLEGAPVNNSVSTQTIASKSVIISRSGYQNDYRYSQNISACGTPMVSETSFEAADYGPAVFDFNKFVSNIQLITALNSKDNTMTISVYKNGVDVSNQLLLTNMGTCKQNFAMPTNNTIRAASNNNSNVVVNLGGVYFDRIAIKYRGDIVMGGGKTAFQLGLCNGLAEDIAPVPVTCTSSLPSTIVVSSTTLPTTFPNVINAGSTINFTATGGTPQQGDIVWNLVSNPVSGILTGQTSGTGLSATATLAAGAKGYVTVTFSATNTTNGCTSAITKGVQTVAVGTGGNTGDNIRSALSRSTAAYDAANKNTWVNVTVEEYAEIYNKVSGSKRYGSFSNVPVSSWCDEGCLSEINLNRPAGYIEILPATFGYKNLIPVGTFVYGFSFRTPPSGTVSSLLQNDLRICRGKNLPSGVMFLNYPNDADTYLPATQLNNDTRYCYVLKTTDGTFNNEYPGIAIDATNILGAVYNAGTGTGYYYGVNVVTPMFAASNGMSHDVQFMGTQTKQW